MLDVGGRDTDSLCVVSVCVGTGSDGCIYIYVCVDCVCVIIAVESRRTGDE